MLPKSRDIGRGLALVFFVFVWIHSDGVSAAETATEPASNDGTDSEDNPTAIEEGMAPLYDMTSNFLDVLQPESRGFILEKIGIDDITTDDGDALEKSLEEDESEWLDHYVGYAICVCVGVFYAVFIPIIGIFFCICRCCGNCGAHQGSVRRSDKCKRICCGIGLGLINTVILAGVVCAFMTSELLRQQSSKPDDPYVRPGFAKDEESYIRRLMHDLDDLEQFKQDSINVYKYIDGGMQEKIQLAVAATKAIPYTTKEKLGELTKSGPVLAKAENLAYTVDAINSSLTYIDEYTQSLIDRGDNLHNRLILLKDNIQDSLDQCSSDQECIDLSRKVDTLARQADYSKVDKIQTQLLEIRDVINGDLKGSIEQGRKEYEDIAQDINADIANTLEDVEAEANRMSDIVSDAVNSGINGVDAMNISSYIEDLRDMEDDVEEYDEYRFYIAIGLSCIMLLIVLFYYLGLVFGIIGDVPGEDAKACNRGIGANLLLVGVGFTFIFGWILMYITIVLFLTGGLPHTEICRYMMDPVENDATNYLDSVISNAFNDSTDENLDFRPAQIMRMCKEGSTVYTAFNMVTIVNATEKLDLSNYGLKEEMNKLKDVNVDLSNIDIISADTRTKLEDLAAVDLDGIDFESFQKELGKDLVTPNLTVLATELDAAAEGLSAQTKQDLNDQAQALRDLEDGLVAQMVSDEKQLAKHLSDLDQELYGNGETDSFSDATRELITEFETAEGALRLQGSQIIVQVVSTQANMIYDQLNGFAIILEQKIREELAPCYDAYVAMDDMIDATCVSVLEPFNGFWFSFGWCLIFGVPSLIFAICLADMYRRTEDYSGKGLDEPNYDAYTGGHHHGDNIPLEDVQHRKMQQRSAQGHANPAYDRDDSRAPYRGNPHGGRYGQNGAGASAYSGNGYGASGYGGASARGGGYEHSQNGHYPGPPSTSPPNPPHYYNNRSQRFY